MITKHIVVEPFDEHWRLDFLKIQNELTDALGQLAISIEHVGSTSVQGLSAKPIIDIDVVIKDYNALKDTISALEKIGYQYEGDLGIPGREAFRYDGKDHLKKHHLYVCPADSPELKRHIAFRNYLRTHPDAVRKYSLIKEEGAKNTLTILNVILNINLPSSKEFIRKSESEISRSVRRIDHSAPFSGQPQNGCPLFLCLDIPAGEICPIKPPMAAHGAVNGSTAQNGSVW